MHTVNIMGLSLIFKVHSEAMWIQQETWSPPKDYATVVMVVNTRSHVN